MSQFDVVVVGAGAAGLHCAGMAGQLGLRVLLIDHAEKVAEKIRISGGGRCNFTNRDTTPASFLSADPAFCRKALGAYTAQDFIALVKRHHIAFHEKHKGQLFCDRSSEDIIAMLLRECAAGAVQRWQPCAVRQVRHGPAGYELDTDRGTVTAPRLVVATGGLPIPQIGATDFGLRLARQFGLRTTDTRPALVPLSFDAAQWAPFVPLAGLSLVARVRTGGTGDFLEDLLFTHRGLSGPAILQISSHWQPGTALQLDLAPTQDLAALLIEAKTGSRRQLGTTLAEHLPRRLAEAWLVQRQASDTGKPPLPPATRFIAECGNRDLQALAASLKTWQITPSGTEGYRKAEVMLGGVDTQGLNPDTLESRSQPGLHFIGEVVDVTGWLGGYNFQWAWASAAACARGMAVAAAR